jgi:hypothetical protein
VTDFREAFAPLDAVGSGSATADATRLAVDETWLAEIPAPDPLPARVRHPRLGQPSRVWLYHNEAGELLFAVCRFDEVDADGKPLLDGKGKSKKQVLPFVFGTLNGRRGWQWKAPPKPRPLYGLGHLAKRPDAPVIITEGEKDADGAAARFPEYVAVTSSGGANAAAATDWTPLAGRTVIVWSDNDQAGTGYATAVVASLRQAGAASVRVVQVPGSWPVGWGLADAVPTAADEAMLQRLLDEATAPPEVGPAVRAEVGAVHTAVHTGPSRESKREKIIEAVLDAGVEFWRDARGEAYATVPREGRLERYPVKARDFRNIALLLFGDANPVAGADGRLRPGSAPGQAMAEAIQSFEAVALRGAVRDPRPRLCRGPDGAVWIDLGGPNWGLVRVAPDGWRTVENADLPLIRPSGMLALPTPARSATALADLRRLINLAGEADFMLVVAWLVAALHPEGPYPVLALDGEQGSGKSTASRMLRRLVDPNHADARAAPRDERDLVIAARNGRVVALDNLSGLDAATADALCRVATGGGFGERMLYTNAEEHVVRVQNPVLPLRARRRDGRCALPRRHRRRLRRTDALHQRRGARRPRPEPGAP